MAGDDDDLVVNERAVVPAAVVLRGSCRTHSSPPTSAASSSVLPARGSLSPPGSSCSRSSERERASDGARRLVRCRRRPTLRVPGGLELMATRQAQVVAAAEAGHRTFLLADERPRASGKTAQALLAAAGRRRVPAARRRAQRGQGQLGPRDDALDAEPGRDRRARQQRPSTASPTSSSSDCDLFDRHVGWLRQPSGSAGCYRDRRGALHQEQDLAGAPARAAALRPDPGPHAARSHSHWHPADRRHRFPAIWGLLR